MREHVRPVLPAISSKLPVRYSKLSELSSWFSSSWFTTGSALSGAVSAELRARLRRVVGEPSRSVSAAFLRVDALGDLRIVTAASLRAEGALRAAGVLRVAPVARSAGLLRAAGTLRLAVDGAAALRVLPFAVVVARGLRVAATGLADFTVRPVVPLAAVLRPVAAVVRDLLAAVVRVVDAVRVAPRFAATGLAARVGVRVVVFAAVARPRVAGAAAALRTGALRVATARLVVPRVVALARVVGAFAARGAEVFAAARPGVLVVLAVDLEASFLAALDRAAGLLAVRMVRDVALRPVDAAVRRPPALTAMALVRRPGVLLSSLLMV